MQQNKDLETNLCLLYDKSSLSINGTEVKLAIHLGNYIAKIACGLEDMD